MMNTQQKIIRLVAVAVLVSLGSCSDDDAGMSGDTAADGGTGGPAGNCDPVGSTPAVGALLNAPLAADVEVIQKTPQHPGMVGPTDLP